MKKNSEFKLAIPTDAISMDIETSILLGLEWGIQYYELKRLFNKRLPSFIKSDIEYIKKSVKKNNVKICSLSPGILKGNVDSEITQNEIDNFDKLINFAEEFETDKIVVFDDGKIVEVGDHKSLLKKKGKYAELWKYQTKGYL